MSSGFQLYRPGNDPSPGSVPGDGTPSLTELSAAPLAEDAEIDLTQDPAAVAVRQVLDEIDAELVGLANVKKRIAEIAALLMVDRARAQFGLSSSRPTLHMSFTGSPGTGKTTVAMRMAQILHALGYLAKPTVHLVGRDDLVGQFIGHTAPKTKQAIARAAGGVLFIDEAYNLYRAENERDYGQEAIEILLAEMESERSSLAVIFAGYPDRMDTFFSANPGLSSRVAHHIAFDDYSTGELAQIAERMLAQDEYVFDDAAREAFAEYLEVRVNQPRFANARSVRNALERARLRHANRLVSLGRPVSLVELRTLTEPDIRTSSVFDAGAHTAPVATSKSKGPS